jgi:hypothetical protein
LRSSARLRPLTAQGKFPDFERIADPAPARLMSRSAWQLELNESVDGSRLYLADLRDKFFFGRQLQAPFQ